MSIKVLRTIPALRTALGSWRAAGETIGLVPTMGALHAGHVELVRRVLEQCDHAVVSIFVNPTQFSPQEDFSRYPRDEAGDLAKLATAGCDLVWSPDASEMYPARFATRVVPGGAAEGLESDFRPHFKLFTQVQPDAAVFGEKDYQQLQVVRQMVRDLNLPLEIIGHPTIRESDGLAMSSRNAYLTPAERRIAPALFKALGGLAAPIADGAEPTAACEAARRSILTAGFEKVDYVEVRDAATLARVERGARGPLRALAAAWLGKTRLIDNIAL